MSLGQMSLGQMSRDQIIFDQKTYHQNMTFLDEGKSAFSQKNN